nr:hypothetical protein [Chloroflexota bacterium]
MSGQVQRLNSGNIFVVISSIVTAIGFMLPWETTYYYGGFGIRSTGYAIASGGLSKQYAHLHWAYYIPIAMALVCGILSLVFINRHSPLSILVVQLLLTVAGLLPFVLFFIEIKWLNQWRITYTEPRFGLWISVIGLIGILFGLWKTKESGG